jgi:hypothetical protein
MLRPHTRSRRSNLGHLIAPHTFGDCKAGVGCWRTSCFRSIRANDQPQFILARISGEFRLYVHPDAPKQNWLPPRSMGAKRNTCRRRRPKRLLSSPLPGQRCNEPGHQTTRRRHRRHRRQCGSTLGALRWRESQQRGQDRGIVLGVDGALEPGSGAGAALADTDQFAAVDGHLTRAKAGEAHD